MIKRKGSKGVESYESKEGLVLLVKEVNEEGSFEGYASVFGKRDLDDEIVEKGAFARTVKHHKGKFPMLWQHYPDEPLGNISGEEDSKGLKVQGKLALSLQKAKDVYEMLKAEIITSLSIGYRVIIDELNRDTGVRHLKELDLWEISVVTFPALPAARITRVKGTTLEMITPLLQDSNRLPELAASLMGANKSFQFEQEEQTSVALKVANAYHRLGRKAPWEATNSFSDLVQHVQEIMPYVEDGSLKGLFPDDLESHANTSLDEPFAWLKNFGKPDPADNIADDIINIFKGITK